MKTCSYCGRENDEFIGHCTDCGSLLEPSEDKQRIERCIAIAERESPLARKLLTIRDARKPWLALLHSQRGLLALKLMLLAAVLSTSWLTGRMWSPAFAIGCGLAFVLIEVALFRACLHNWPLMEEWIDWEAVEHSTGTSAPQQGEEPLSAEFDGT